MVTTEGNKLDRVGLAVLLGRGSDGLGAVQEATQWQPGVIPPCDSQVVFIIYLRTIFSTHQHPYEPPQCSDQRGQRVQPISLASGLVCVPGDFPGLTVPPSIAVPLRG